MVCEILPDVYDDFVDSEMTYKQKHSQVYALSAVNFMFIWSNAQMCFITQTRETIKKFRINGAKAI